MAFALRPQAIDFNQVWGDLRRSVVTILQLQPIMRIEWDHKFHDVYNICVAVPESLCDKLYQSLQKCVEEHVQELYDKISKVPNDQLLATYSDMWKIFYQGALYVHSLFRYLNKQYVKNKRNLEPDLAHQYSNFILKDNVKEVGCMALDIWKQKLITPLLDKLLVLLIDAIAEDRKGNPLNNKAIVHDVIMSFVQVEQFDFAEENSFEAAKHEAAKDYYQKNFEISFLRDTEQYYTILARQLLADLSCSKYMEEVIKIIEAEKTRCSAYVHRSTVDKVIKLCQNVMVSAHKDKLNAVCTELIRHEEKNDLRNMYKLMKPIENGLTVMVKAFEDYVKQKGQEAVADLLGDNIHNQFVENVLSVYDKYSEMKINVFMDDGDFTGALDKALQAVVNSRTDKKQPSAKASERLARYCDALLRKNTKGTADTDVDIKLTRAIIIFRYIEDKDVFQKFYAKMLSNRLINGTSVSMDAEESMINKLKLACGYEFTSKLSRMFTDIGLCEELQKDFEKWLLDKNHKFKFSMLPFVLTAGSWPLAVPTAGGSGCPPTQVESVGFVIPRDLQQSIDRFQEYYGQKYNGRKLTWLYNSCSADVRTNYLDKNYHISGSLFQISTLLIFNHHDSQSIADISDTIGVTGDLIIKICHTHITQGLLLCSDKDITINSALTLNRDFVSKRLKFKLPTVQSTKAAEKEAETVNHTVAQDRKYYVECAVVRIMKTRKVLKHNQLINEVMDQIKGRFKPDLQLVKKCIEDLIDKLYIQRTNSHDEYQYLA